MHAEYFHQLQFIVEVSFDHEKEKEKRFQCRKIESRLIKA